MTISKESHAMRKLISTLFISLDGVVESPDRFLRGEMYPDLPEEMDKDLSGQDAVLLGRKIYEEWAGFWPTSDIEPFASFINSTPKWVVGSQLPQLDWNRSAPLGTDVVAGISRLKAQPGLSIGVHGIALVQSLLLSGMLDELRLVTIPAIAGSGRHLLDRDGPPMPMDLQSSRATPTGMLYSVYTPRR
jgi:dihydrofolate reductase